MMDWHPLWLSLQLSAITTALLFVPGVWLADLLIRLRDPWKPLLQALVSMPLVLPPTVIGFYLLLAWSPGTLFGQWLEQTLGYRLAFSFSGLVIASMLYSLPFMVNPLFAALSALPASLEEAARILGKGHQATLWLVRLPNIRPAMLNALVLTFAHTMGEFGVVLMIGGNIPGQTRVASVAIYDRVESMEYAAAHTYSLILMGLSMAILVSIYFVNRRITL